MLILENQPVAYVVHLMHIIYMYTHILQPFPNEHIAKLTVISIL